MNASHVCILGGSGFVGSHVVRIFEARGAEVAAPRHSEIDVTDRRAVLDSVGAFRPEVVRRDRSIVRLRVADHLAPPSGRDHPFVQPFPGVTEMCVGALALTGAEAVE